ncbi:MAG: hypothetical protein K2O89_04295 [Clostridia bacterium]|nr:hypothetical protein [Clostridia bacterium]
MTIHHDKLAYGRLARTSEEMTDKQVEEMLKALAEEGEKEERGTEEKPRSKGGKKE